MRKALRVSDREAVLAFIRERIAQRKALGYSTWQLQWLLDEIAYDAGLPAHMVRAPIDGPSPRA